METIYDVMKDRLQVTETTLMVTILSGPRQGIRLFTLKMVACYMVQLLKALQ
nr:hypothetical protein [Veillonella rogosae]